MAEIKKIPKEGKSLRKKKPLFVRKDAHKRGGVPFKWRKPRGRHSPVRQKHRGRPKLVSIGYGSPKEIRNLHPSGLESVLVSNRKELEKIEAGRQGAIISQTVGKRKRMEIIQAALEKKIAILNFKEPRQYLEELQSEFRAKKETKKKKLSEKEEKEEEKKKKAEEKKREEEQKGEEKEEKSKEEAGEEKRKEEKKEKDKTLTKKQ